MESEVFDESTATVEREHLRSVESEPAVPFDYTAIPPGHYDRAYKRGSGVQSKWHHLKFDRVAAEVGERRRVLDVGCGPGTLLGALGEGHESVGVDITAPQIDYANEEYASATRSFYACALQDLPDLPPFDAITAVELIEHLPEEMAEEMLEDAVRRLRPDGKLILTTPDYGSAWPLVERAVDRLGDVEYFVQHINKFKPARLEALLTDLGLADVHVSKYLFAAPFAAALGWRFADLVSRLESGWIENHLGLIMLGTGIKPA